jgi:hypothetical protein
MHPKALKVEPLSPGYWERYAPPVDQELWKLYMNEDDSDSDASNTEEEEPMPVPLAASKATKSEAPEARPKPKNVLVSYLKLFSSSRRVLSPSYADGTDFSHRPEKFWTYHSTT